ncbi:Similar to ZSWIM9: Uncharacterized protein ZSWIM9 (Homo sapiens) [Cotesia congregata]|uniref:Similar to ZSWIM9: Uncharacterized protein ZSWIM9 (Homo sapiens) n=1 Tax=Cotesia congregata TaxID=51543 RepID=A0A8J2H4Y7_COTCN|nr:Similar to ZSWIM9: Uncharacterized protein ZSWIM9 (Homo sapiens) [Cotesia congregata]
MSICQATIKLYVTRDRQKLRIYEVNLNHQNHDGSEIFFSHLPENRKLSPKTTKEVADQLKLKPNKKFLQDKIIRETGKFPTIKDLQNLNANKINRNHNGNDLKEAKKLLEQKGADVHILSDGTDFHGLYFSTNDMKNSMKAWPEVVFMDGTYNLLDSKLTTMILMVEDSNGISEIVAIGLLANEKYETIKWYLETFLQNNQEACTRMKCVMTDKDLVVRKAIKEVFPHVSLYLCLFHTLKSFSKQIKTKEMHITGEDKDKCLSILQSLAYSSSPEEYDKIYAKFCEQAPTSVIDYFNKNWHNIRDEWTSYSMVNGNLDNKTNNRLENLNGKLKQVLGRENTLIEFINSFFIWDRSHNIASATKAMKNFYTKPSVNNYSPCEQLYSEILTNKAFEYVQKELKAADFVTILHSDLHTHHCTI